MIRKQTLLANIFYLITVWAIFTVHPAQAHSWLAPPAEADRLNPIATGEASVARGRAIFSENCQSCHGEDGRGMSKKLTGLGKQTPNLAQRLRSHSEGDFHWKIIKGRGDMPPFGEDFSDEEIWHIINYIKTL